VIRIICTKKKRNLRLEKKTKRNSPKFFGEKPAGASEQEKDKGGKRGKRSRKVSIGSEKRRKAEETRKTGEVRTSIEQLVEI